MSRDEEKACHDSIQLFCDLSVDIDPSSLYEESSLCTELKESV